MSTKKNISGIPVIAEWEERAIEFRCLYIVRN